MNTFKKAVGVGIIISLISALLYGKNTGDFDNHGWPIAFYNGVWGMGMNYHFNPIFFLANTIVWIVICYVFIRVIAHFRRKKLT